MRKYPQLSDKKWLVKEISKKPLRQIAEEVGCSYSAVVYQSQKLKINIPKRFKRRVFETKSLSQKAAYKKKYPNGRHGEDHPNWKGGKRTSGHKGYIKVYVPDHPNAVQGTIFEHRLVAEKTLGRYLEKDEIVHHINHIKDDNRPENLQVVRRGEHVANHFKEPADLQREIARLKSLLTKHGIEY